ncbi:hypothetical protein P3T76_012237 [Phytophthora citrophthora]|uniref:RxLR effector protein n=1 Tax=Phytophthora citrophthora TaxID=4793 RepID=A0AAD9LD50_9STRA|nr:hypothetical protein P3T76_012237 [Phytophthora citrophthora]
MRLSFYLILFVSTSLACTEALPLGAAGSPSDSMKMEVKKTLTRLRRVHVEETEDRMFIPPIAAYSNLLHSTTTSTQSSQILHAAANHRPLPKEIKAVIAIIGVGIVTGAIITSAVLTTIITKAFG